MKLNLFHLLCLAGLLPVSVCILQTAPNKYELIMTSMTWPDAQNYCRVKYSDLATILSDTDWLRLNIQTTSNGFTSFAWTGFYKDIYNWRWSLNNLPLKDVPFTNWYPGQPENFAVNEMCGIIAAHQQWYDVQCTLVRAFICYDANFIDANKFIGISNPLLTWPEALSYCRTHFTDLASSLNSSDDAILSQIQINQGDSWIGLNRDMDTWKRSDGTIASNIAWYPGQPDNYYGENCAVVYNGYFYDDQCTNLHYFFCETIPSMRSQIIRLQVESQGSVFTSDMHSSILEQIKQKLIENGMWEKTTVNWRLQPDGNIFHKEINKGLTKRGKPNLLNWN